MITDELKMQIGKIETQSDCREAWNLVKHRWDLLIRKQAEQFYVGQVVQFLSKKTGWLEGTIERINSKSITVQVGTVRWSVDPSLLKAKHWEGTNG